MPASTIKLQEGLGYHEKKSEAIHAQRLSKERAQRRKAASRERVRKSVAIWLAATVVGLAAAFGTVAVSASAQSSDAAPVRSVHAKPHARAPRFTRMNPGHIVEYFLVHFTL